MHEMTTMYNSNSSKFFRGHVACKGCEWPNFGFMIHPTYTDCFAVVLKKYVFLNCFISLVKNKSLIFVKKK